LIMTMGVSGTWRSESILSEGCRYAFEVGIAREGKVVALESVEDGLMQDTRVLEAGSNFFELIEFTVTSPQSAEAAKENGLPPVPMRYGVNVAKVREVIRLPEIVPCLTTCPEVLGVFNLRGIPIPAIHLALALGYKNDVIGTNHQMIVTEFSGRVSGFVVSSTHRIRRVSWDKILPPTSDAFRSITGMMVLGDGEFVFMTDFEDIVAEIEKKSGAFGRAGNSSKSASPAEVLYGAFPAERIGNGEGTILVVEDSPVARKAVSEIVRGLGFGVIEASDGEIGWEILMEFVGKSDLGRLKAVITDIEMPRLDGFSLIKRIRSDSALQKMPVVVHSSLSGEGNKERALAVGANGFASKFNRKEIVDRLRNAIAGTGGAE
jgi:two-component system chemotaxis response regulator CheV